MTTQHTADHEKPDHEPRVEAWAHADSKAHTSKTPHSKKNWDRKTRRRHSVSATNFPSASDQTSSESVVSTPSEPESLEYEQPSPEAASAADSSKPAEQTPTKVPSTNASPIKDYSQPAEEGLPERQAEEPSSLKDYSLPAQTPQVDLLPSDAPLAKESLAEEESLTKESSAEEPLEQVLEIAQETSETTLEETVAEEVAREEAVVEETAEETVEEVAEEAAEEVAEETAEEVAEEAADLEMALEDELEDGPEDELTEVAEEPELRSARRQPWKAKRHAQAKQAYREERRDQKSRFTEDPRSFSEQLRMPSQQQQQYDQEPQTQFQSQLQSQQSQPQPLPEQPQAQQQTRDNRQAQGEQQPQSAPRTQSEQQVKSEQKKQSQKKKQRQRSQHYLKSSSLKQAFRNLLKLNGGAAWRETRYAIVTFFVLFSLLALAVADSLPAVDAFNAAIISVVHSVRGMLDTFVITLTTIGDFLPMGALCLVVCLILYLGKKWDSLAFFVVNVVLALVCVQALKFIFAVPRPTEETLVPLPQSFSFPSAHSFCSLIVFGLIGLLIYRALVRRGASDRAAMIPGIVLIVFAILVGISRIYVGVHWPSDVLGGWLLAGTWLSYVGALYTAGARQATSSTR